MHSEKVLHRDLKPDNVFVTDNLTLKIGDFGISKVLDLTADYARSVSGTRLYFSSEILNRLPYNSKSDMWAAACVLHEITTLKRTFNPANDYSFITIINKINTGEYGPLPNVYSVE